MASMVDELQARLVADATLVGTLGINGYSGLLNGGVWTRPLRREPPAATEEAFYTASTGGKAMRNGVCVIVDRGDQPHRQESAVPGAYTAVPYVYLYAGATAAGKAAIIAARKRIYVLLDHDASDGWTFETDEGPIAFVEYVDRIGIQNSEEFPEAVFDYCRYRVTSRHASLV